MSNKIKSSLYFASFVIAAIIYYNAGYTNDIPTNELASADIEKVSTIETFK